MYKVFSNGFVVLETPSLEYALERATFEDAWGENVRIEDESGEIQFLRNEDK